MYVVGIGPCDPDSRAWRWTIGVLALPVVAVLEFGPEQARVVRAGPVVVQVVIHPNRLELPRSLAAGEVIFEARNRDTVTHGLAVRPAAGGAPIGRLELPLRPGATGRMRVRLDVGEYRVYCPNAVQRGLLRPLSVVGRERDQPPLRTCSRARAGGAVATGS